jgi:hypothetical protein
MRSKVAEEVQEAQQREMLARTPAERLELALRLGDEALRDFAQAHGLTIEEARRELRHRAQSARPHYSRSKAG